MMRSPSAPAGNLFNAPPAPPPADIFAPRAAEVQRDEFSHLVASSKPLQQPDPSPKAAPPAKAKSSNLPVILIVGGLLLVAIVLVLVFALMR